MSIVKIKTSNREEWKKLRKKYIGGSDAAAVVGLNNFSSPYALWAEKTGKVQEFEGNLSTEVGTYLEEFVAQKFATETGKKVRKCNYSMVNTLYPFAIANIDREIVGEDAGLEIKSTDSLNLKLFKNGEYPANYYCQCVHYLAVTGKKRWYLAVLIGNRDFKHFIIERDQAEINALMQSEAEFWKLVESDTPPAVDGSKATTEAISEAFDMSDDTEVDLSAFNASLMQYGLIKDRIKELETEAEEVINGVKSFMGSSGSGRSDNFRISWKTQQRRYFDSKRFAEENPEIDIDEYYNTTTSRAFRVTKIKGE